MKKLKILAVMLGVLFMTSQAGYGQVSSEDMDNGDDLNLAPVRTICFPRTCTVQNEPPVDGNVRLNCLINGVFYGYSQVCPNMPLGRCMQQFARSCHDLCNPRCSHGVGANS